ncbi:helix-turn-helix transcriptional regulator [Moritella viscosa]|uniref:Putative transcriptional regulator n=1 Tax=Moritella viscosa TaxID=80854 RepID=A0A1L0CP56_9GAMM|nr:hypothetical protein [Moritella viscosa]SGZ19911.1 Putative transcriptional regulator [Moritella viscosa]
MNYKHFQQPVSHYQLIRRPAVLTLTTRSKSALQLDEKNGLFCPPISIEQRAVAYIKNEVELLIQARIEGQRPEQIKVLVQKLIDSRTANKGRQINKGEHLELGLTEPQGHDNQPPYVLRVNLAWLPRLIQFILTLLVKWRVIYS